MKRTTRVGVCLEAGFAAVSLATALLTLFRAIGSKALLASIPTSTPG